MKVIGFVSSSRKNGNTTKLVSKALEFAKLKGYDTQLINLNDLSIKGCNGCNYCKVHDNCAIQDDFQKICELIETCDYFIFGSPIYFFDINGQARLLEDRFYSLIDGKFNTKLSGPKSSIIITSQNTQDPKACEQNILKHNLALKMVGINNVGTLITCGSITEDSSYFVDLQKLMDTLLQ